jgi:hypothetical protein
MFVHSFLKKKINDEKFLALTSLVVLFLRADAIRLVASYVVVLVGQVSICFLLLL